MTLLRTYASRTAVLMGIALVLLIFVVTVERKWKTTGEVERTSRLLAEFPMDRIRQIRIQSQGERIVLVKGEPEWRFTEPLEDLVNPERIEQIVEEIGDLVIVETISRGDGMVRELGLGRQDAVEVELEFEKGVPDRKIYFGRRGPLRDTAYVEAPEVEGRTKLYLVRTSVRDWLEDPAESLRDRRLLRLDPGSIRSYEMRRAEGSVELEREADAPRWYLTRPLMTRANDDIAFSLIDELCSLEVAEFLDKGSVNGPGTLDAGTAIFRLQPEEGDPVQIWLREEAGGPGDEMRMVAQVSNRANAFEIRDDLVSRLPRTVNQLRYPYLADIESATVARIRIESLRDPSVELAHDGEGWRLILGGEVQRANEERVDRLLAALNAEPILEFRSDSASRLEEFGLDRPLMKLSVTTSQVDGALYDRYQKALEKARLEGKDPGEVPEPEVVVETQTILFGKSRPPGALLNAHFEGTPFIYGIDPALVQSTIPTHPLKWRGRRLLNFSLLAVRSVTVAERGQPALRLDYTFLENAWDATVGGEPAERPVDRRKAEDLVRNLGTLEAEDWLTSRLAAYQALENPSCRVGVELTQPEGARFELDLAPVALEGSVIYYFGRFVGHPDAFILSAESYERLLEPVWKVAEVP